MADVQKRAEDRAPAFADKIRSVDEEALLAIATSAIDFGFPDESMIDRIFRAETVDELLAIYVEFAVDSSRSAGLTETLSSYAEDEALLAAAAMIRFLVAAAAEVVAATLVLAIQRAWNRQRTQAEIVRRFLLTAQQATWVDNFERKLRRNPAQALANELRDSSLDDELRRAVSVDEPLSERQITRQVERYRMNWVRARTNEIARDLMFQASNAVENAVWTQAEESGVLRVPVTKFWNTRRDAAVRDAHRQVPGLNALGRDLRETFVTPLGNLRYPGDPRGVIANIARCRCYLTVRPPR